MLVLAYSSSSIGVGDGGLAKANPRMTIGAVSNQMVTSLLSTYIKLPVCRKPVSVQVAAHKVAT